MKMKSRFVIIFALGCLPLLSCSDSDDWSKMSPDKKANLLDAQMADRFNYLQRRIDELEDRVENLENNRR